MNVDPGVSPFIDHGWPSTSSWGRGTGVPQLRTGTVLMNMLERLLETTEIDARDVETEQTLLEYACHTGNMGLAKLCYRRGANLSAKTQKGETAFNIVTQNKRYDSCPHRLKSLQTHRSSLATIRFT